MRKFTLLVGLSLGCLSSCASEQQIEMGENGRALAIGDLNQDGRADLIVASLGEPSSTGLEPEQLLVRLGTGRRTFGDIVRSPGLDAVVDVLLADMDEDSILDVVGIKSYGYVSTFLGTGNGSFLPGAAAGPCDTRSPSGGVGDFDQDGSLDVALLCRGEGGPTYMYTLFGRSGSSFELGHSYTSLSVAVAASAIASGDLNGDGAVDLVIVGGHGGEASAMVHLNDGSGRFEALAPVPAPASAVQLVDVDGDAILDAVTAGTGLAILRGNGHGTLAAAHTISSGELLEHLAVSDLNADGAPDVAAIGGSELHLFIARSDGQYARRTLEAGQSPADLAIADFDANGWGDVAVLNGAPSTVTVHFDAAGRRQP